MSSEAELAGVLAHEIGHVEHRDQVAELERLQGANMGLTLAYVLMGRQPSAIEQAGIQVAGSAVFAHYDRGMESNADAEAVALTKTDTRQYAKRQMTWFRKMAGVVWFSPDDGPALEQDLRKRLQ